MVQVRVGGGRAWITGNASAPPTDDTTAREAGWRARSAVLVAHKAQGSAQAAQNTASTAESKADVASTTASNAQSTADGAATAADTAQAAADTAQAAADTAQTTADAAQKTASQAVSDAGDARKVATNYLSGSDEGLTVAPSSPDAPSGANLSILSDRIQIKQAERLSAEFQSQSVDFYNDASYDDMLETEPSDWSSSSPSDYTWNYAQAEKPVFPAGLLSDKPIDFEPSGLQWAYSEVSSQPYTWGKKGAFLVHQVLTVAGSTENVSYIYYFDAPSEDGTLKCNPTAGNLTDSTTVLFTPTGGQARGIATQAYAEYYKVATSAVLDQGRDWCYTYTVDSNYKVTSGKNTYSYQGEFYQYDGTTMTRIGKAGGAKPNMPTFKKGQFFRKIASYQSVPVYDITAAGLSVNFSSGLFYRPAAEYGSANTTAAEYSAYQEFTDGTGFSAVDTSSTPAWKENHIFTQLSADLLKAVPDNLAPLTFIASLFYKRVTSYEITASFGRDGATIGPVVGKHVKVDDSGLSLWRDQEHKIMEFGAGTGDREYSIDGDFSISGGLTVGGKTIGIGGPAADASPNSNGLTQVRTDVEIRGKVSRWAPGKVISSRYIGAGYITGSAKRIAFMIPFPYIDLYNIKLTALSITVRQGGKYLLGGASSSYNALSQTSARMQPEGIDITIDLSSAPSGAVNNDVIGIWATYTVEVTA